MSVHASELRVERRPAGRLLFGLLRRPAETLAEVIDGRDVVFLTLAGKRMVALNHPALVESVFADPEARGRISGLADSTARKLGGTSLPGLEGDEHRSRRSIVEELFRDPAPWTSAITRAAEQASERWSPGVIDAQAAMERLSVDAVARAVFGDDYNRHRSALSEYYDVSRKAVMRIINPFSALLWRMPLPLTARFERAQSAFNDALAAMVSGRRSNGSQDDLLGQLLRARADDGTELSDVEARDEAWSYYSQSAPAFALTWATWLLGRDREVDERVHAEAEEALAGDSLAPLERLPVMGAVVREAVRLYPPGWALVHPAARAHELGRETVERGTPVLVSPWVLHRDRRLWPAADTFDPDRWLGARATEIRPGSFVAFGAGPRRCPARPFAEALVTLILATVVRRWRLRPTVDAVRLAYVPFLRPKGGLPVELVARAGG